MSRPLASHIIVKPSHFSRKNDDMTWMGVTHGEDLAYLFGLPLSEDSRFYNPDYRHLKQWGSKDKYERLQFSVINYYLIVDDCKSLCRWIMAWKDKVRKCA